MGYKNSIYHHPLMALAAPAVAAVLFTAVSACVSQKKIEVVRTQNMSAHLALSQEMPDDNEYALPSSGTGRDTVAVTDENGNTFYYMSATYEGNDVTVHDVLEAAVVTARFRNVAERHGRIDLGFDIIVPQAMLDNDWQLRFYPDMYILEDSLRLDAVHITGAGYRHGQIKGYERYNRFLSTIISDSTLFIDYRNLEIFIKRNIPDLYAFKTDSSYVSEEKFLSVYGVSERMAIEHYTNTFAEKMNERRKAKREKMYAKYVKAPIVTDGVRLDTVIQNINGDYIYQYTQTINTRPKLRKVDVVLSGDIYQQDQRLYSMARTEPLTFYISSVSAFVDGTERYLTKVIERKVEANTSARVDFAVGKADIDKKLGTNADELRRIEGYLHDILEDSKFDLDSIVVSASASPEGALASNEKLSLRRASSVSDYCDGFIKHYKDSLNRVYRQEARENFHFVLDDEGNEVSQQTAVRKAELPDIRFVSKSGGENWPYLSYLVETDTLMTPQQKEDFAKRVQDYKDVDAREASMRGQAYYPYMKRALYPDLRTVHFDFHLHRKGMVKDTVHTTVLDTAYMNGVQAIRDHDYETALTLLRPYDDYNTAIAYVSLDYNASALAILEKLEKTDQVNYMLALLYSRRGDEQKAVQHYMRSCEQNSSYVFRGGLDPEIAALIRKYGLNKQDEDEYDLNY